MPPAAVAREAAVTIQADILEYRADRLKGKTVNWVGYPDAYVFTVNELADPELPGSARQELSETMNTLCIQLIAGTYNPTQ